MLIERVNPNDLFLEPSEGYAKPQQKSTSLPSIIREVCEHGAQND